MKQYNSKTHTDEELITAVKSGKRLVAFDSGNSGNDAIFILEKDETLWEIRNEILEHYEIDNWPRAWSLEVIENPMQFLT